MNGLYIHVPFCQKRCIYCDFYSTTCGEVEKSQYVQALGHEIELRADYLPSRTLHTIYIGGGTPSQLSPDELEEIFNTISRTFQIAEDAEITLEANPDDVTEDFASALRELPVNRVSMGVQTFDDHLLLLLNRRHTAKEALTAVERLIRNGIQNISLDLIYGLPQQTLEQWKYDVSEALQLPIRHLSAYALIYEKGTPLFRMREEGIIKETDEDISVEMFRILMDTTEKAGMEHYEISNFAYPGWRARHNSGYWQNMYYLGCGPAAHSYNGKSRQWNSADLEKYLAAQGNVADANLVEQENLSQEMKFNETILKSIRTSDGLNLAQLKNDFGDTRTKQLLSTAKKYLDKRLLSLDRKHNILRLTRNGIFVSDGIMSDLMEIDTD